MKPYTYEETLGSLLEKVDKMECKLSSSKSLNGGFDKLMLEIEHIKETQMEVLQGIRGVKKNLYEPDSGLFSRVKELESESNRRQEYITETKPMLEEHREISLWKLHAEKDLEELESLRLEVAELRNWRDGISKFIWLIGTAAGGMWVKHFMDLLMQ